MQSMHPEVSHFEDRIEGSLANESIRNLASPNSAAFGMSRFKAAINVLQSVTLASFAFLPKLT